MNKKYLLIGASSGIGFALAQHLLENDHEVIAISRDRGSLPPEVEYFPCDVTSYDTPLPTIESPIDGIVYLPGTITLKPFSQLKIEDFYKDIEINYLSAVRAIQEYLPAMNEESTTSITLMSSVAATTGFPFHSSIAGAKAAIEGFALSLAAELAPKVRVNVVAPSITQTRLAEPLTATEDKKDKLAKRHPLQEIGHPRDIASMIAYLLSDESNWITGQVFHVDGGISSLRL